MLLLLVILCAADLRGCKTNFQQVQEQASLPSKVKYMQYCGPGSIFLPGCIYHTLCSDTDDYIRNQRGGDTILQLFLQWRRGQTAALSHTGDPVNHHLGLYHPCFRNKGQIFHPPLNRRHCFYYYLCCLCYWFNYLQ